MNNESNQNASGWYAPLQREEKRPAPEVEPAPKKKRKGLSPAWRVTLCTLLLVGLITASSLIFRDESPAMPELPTAPADTLPYFLPYAPDLPEEFPKDWREFFDSYYIPEDNSAGETNIPAVEERPDWQMELLPPEKREKTLQEVYRDVVDSIVMIHGYVDGRSGYYFGSGIIASEDGIIITNAHMIEGCDSAKVTLSDNTEYQALLVGSDWTSDLAVLKIEAEGLHPAVFGDSACLSVGDRVAAIGNPIGEELRTSLTDGIVSAIGRQMDFEGHSISMIQSNTAINEGNSGGALVNMYGQVVGVTNMKLVSYYSTIEGIAFAIPSTTLAEVVNGLIQDGEVSGRPALGITVGEITDAAAEYYELPAGLYVSAVSENSDACGKLRVGDIITAVNGVPARTTDDILRARKELAVGDTLTFTVWREGESFDVTVATVDYNDVY